MLRLWEQILYPLGYSGLDINENAVEHYLNSQDLPCWKHNLICSGHGQSYYGKPSWEKRRVTCFCAGPGIQNIQGPLQNPGISYYVDSLSVGITHFPLTGLRSWRQLASENTNREKKKKKQNLKSYFLKAAEVDWFLIIPKPTEAIKLKENLPRFWSLPWYILFFFPNALVGRSRGLL